MAVTGVALLRAGSASATALRRKYTDIYQVQTDSPANAQALALTASHGGESVPDIGDVHPVDSDATVTDKNVGIHDTDGVVWNVDVTYQTPTGGSQQEQPNPLDEPLRVRVIFREYTEVAEQDRDGDAILNAAADSFDPPIERVRHAPVLEFTWNQADFDLEVAEQYIDCVNSKKTTLAGLEVDAGNAKIADINADRLLRNGIAYWGMTLAIELNRNGFTREILNQGLSYLPGGVLNDKTKIMEKGKAVTEPKLLKMDGDILPNPSPSTATWIPADLEDEIDFAGLGLKLADNA